jgi:hypothetical protein
MEHYLDIKDKLEVCFMLKKILDYLMSLELSDDNRKEYGKFIQRVEQIIDETIGGRKS